MLRIVVIVHGACNQCFKYKKPGNRLQAQLASHGRYLPAYVTKELDEYLKCGRLECGFLRVRCESCHDEKLVAFSCKKRGFCPGFGAPAWPTALRCW